MNERLNKVYKVLVYSIYKFVLNIEAKTINEIYDFIFNRIELHYSIIFYFDEKF